jgi:hypothetical protein
MVGKPTREKVLQHSTIEFYVGIILAIVLVVFTITPWLKVLLLVVLGGIIIDLIFRSPLTINRHRILKTFLSIAATLFLVTISWNPVKEQWIKDHQIKEESPGPRLEFAGLKAEHNYGYYSPFIQVDNASDIPISSYFLTGYVFLSNYENNTENKDIRELVARMEDDAKKIILIPGSGMPITRGMRLLLELQQQFSDNDIVSVNNGMKKMYVVMLAIYRSAKTPNNEKWVTESCVRVTKPFTEFQSCPAYNKYYLADMSLSTIY